MLQNFGPIVGIQSVDSTSEVTKIINSSQYGLESMIFTRNENHVSEFANSLEVGTVNFNLSPLVNDDLLPVSGRNRCRKVLKGSKHVFRKYSKFKALNI